MTITLSFELLGSEPDELFLEDFILMSDPSCLFLGLIALLAHRFYIHLERLSSILQDSDLLASCWLVIVQFVHLVVVHLNVTSQIDASTFRYT